MDAKFQIESWVRGISIHDTEHNVCCPDFSCCCPYIETPQVAKDRFYVAWVKREIRVLKEMATMFYLCKVLEGPEKDKVVLPEVPPGIIN